MVRNVVGADTNFASMRYLAWYRPDGNFLTLPHDARDPMASPELNASKDAVRRALRRRGEATGDAALADEAAEV